MLEKVKIILETDTHIYEYEIKDAYGSDVNFTSPEHSCTDQFLYLVYEMPASFTFTTSMQLDEEGHYYTVTETEKNPLKIEKIRTYKDMEIVLVTEKNLEKVAEWCGGEVKKGDPRTGLMDHVNLPFGAGDAFPGMWIVDRDPGNSYYYISYEKPEGEVIDD